MKFNSNAISKIKFLFKVTIFNSFFINSLYAANSAKSFNEFKTFNTNRIGSIKLNTETECPGLYLDLTSDKADDSLKLTAGFLADEIEKMKSECKSVEDGEIGIDVAKLKAIKDEKGLSGKTVEHATELSKQISGSLEYLQNVKECNNKTSFSQKASQFLRIITPAVEKMDNTTVNVANTVLQASLNVINSADEGAKADQINSLDGQNKVGRALCEMYKVQNYARKYTSIANGSSSLDDVIKKYFIELDKINEYLSLYSNDQKLNEIVNTRKLIMRLGIKLFSELSNQLISTDEKYEYLSSLDDNPPKNIEALLDLLNPKSVGKYSIAGVSSIIAQTIEDSYSRSAYINNNIYQQFVRDLSVNIDKLKVEIFKSKSSNISKVDYYIKENCFNLKDNSKQTRKCWSIAKSNFVKKIDQLNLSESVFRKYILRVATEFTKLVDSFDNQNLSSIKNDVFQEWNAEREALANEYNLLFTITDNNQRSKNDQEVENIESKLKKGLGYLYNGNSGVVYRWIDLLARESEELFQHSVKLIDQVNSNVIALKKSQEFKKACPVAFNEVSMALKSKNEFNASRQSPMQFGSSSKPKIDIKLFLNNPYYYLAVNNIYDLANYDHTPVDTKDGTNKNNTGNVGVTLHDSIEILNNFVEGVRLLRETSVYDNEIKFKDQINSCLDVLNSYLPKSSCVQANEFVDKTFSSLERKIRMWNTVCKYNKAVLYASSDETKLADSLCSAELINGKLFKLNKDINEFMLYQLKDELNKIKNDVCAH